MNFLAHGQRSSKLRRVKVIPTDVSPDSDVSSLDSVSESLKSEDVFTGTGEFNNDEGRDSPGTVLNLCNIEHDESKRH